MRRLAALAASAAMAMMGCSPFGGGSFACADDIECSSGASAGVCESTGFCSFADGSCASGRRYGDLAGNGLSGVCVGEEPSDAAVAADADPNAPDADPDQPDADPGAPDAMPNKLCDPQAGLVACFLFENNVDDLSGTGNDGTAAGEAYATGVDGQAISIAGAATLITIAEDATLDIPNLTIEMHVRPGVIPAAGRDGILDNDGQWGIFMLPGGILRCTGGGLSNDVTGALSQGVFTHVAYTYDGTTSRVYVDGVEQIVTGGVALGSGNNGTRIGGNLPSGDDYTGLVDNLRIWNVVRTRAQICTDSLGACTP